MTPDEAVAALAAAGCVAADLDAAELVAAAEAGLAPLDDLVERRCAGESVAVIVGTIRFGPVDVAVDRDVYVPRVQTVPMALAAASALPHDGVAVDVCTGTGAIAVLLQTARPAATVVASDRSAAAAATARRNSVDVFVGDLLEPIPGELAGRIDIVTAVPPYVPRSELHLLPRDVLAHEPIDALDGGDDGLDVVRRLVVAVPEWLTDEGQLFVEIGGGHGPPVRDLLFDAGFHRVTLHHDDEGDLRWVHARLST